MCISSGQESTQPSTTLLLLLSSFENAVKARVQLEASEVGEIQAPVAHERKVVSRQDLHQVKDLFVYFLKILT